MQVQRGRDCSGCGCRGASRSLENQTVTPTAPGRSDVSRDFLAASYFLEIETYIAPTTTRSSNCRSVALGQQSRDQLAMTRHLGLATQAAGSEDRAHLVDGDRKVFVDDDVVELAVVRHLLARSGQPLGDDRLAVLPARMHALLEEIGRAHV